MHETIFAFHAVLVFLFVSAILLACISGKTYFSGKLLNKRKCFGTEVPGPALARWSRLWLVKTLFSGKLAYELIELHHKYGPIVRIGPRHIILSDAETVRRILAVGSKYTRGPWFDSLRLHITTPNVISEREPRRHSQLRSILGPGLAGHGVPQMETNIDGHIESWIRRLRDTTGSESIDLSQSIPFLTVDIISHLCLGKSFDCSTSQTDKYGFLRAMRCGMFIQQYTSVFPELQGLLSWAGKLPFFRPFIFPTHEDNFGVGPTMQFIFRTLEKVDGLHHWDEGKADMLTSFLARGLPRDQAESEMIIILAGGTDTTSTAAQGVIFSILSNPAVYSRLQSKIDQFSYTNRRDLRFPIQDAMARKLPYLQACIHEGLRKFPPLFQLRERLVPLTGDHIHGYQIPAGTYVGINGLATQLDDVYGSDPNVYRPERWLSDDTARLKHMHRTLELVFGYGASKCLGVKMAYTELNKIIFELFANFDVSFLNPSEPWKRSARGIFIQSDFKVKIKQRDTINERTSTRCTTLE